MPERLKEINKSRFCPVSGCFADFRRTAGRGGRDNTYIFFAYEYNGGMSYREFRDEKEA